MLERACANTEKVCAVMAWREDMKPTWKVQRVQNTLHVYRCNETMASGYEKWADIKIRSGGPVLAAIEALDFIAEHGDAHDTISLHTNLIAETNNVS